MGLTIYERVGRAMVRVGSKGLVRAELLWGGALGRSGMGGRGATCGRAARAPFAKEPCGRPPDRLAENRAAKIHHCGSAFFW